MVCPMKNQAKRVEVTSEYPYMSLYRPWSWILSSFFNIFLFAVILGVLYLLYKSRKNKRGQKRAVTYRTVQMQESTTEKANQVSALVTGGNGALGREIVKSLLADGSYSVQSLDILLPEEQDRIEDVRTYIQADVTSYEDLCIAFRGVDVVFHCVGLTPASLRHTKEDYYQVNVIGTENVIKACMECGVKRMLYTSSASVTLSKNPKVSSCDADESRQIPSDPLNIYIATKGKADQLVRAANGKDGFRTCVLRPNAFLHTIFTAFEENSYCPNFEGYELSVVPVESVAQAHLLAEKKLSDEGGASMVAGKAYNICDQKISLSEFANYIASEKKTSVTFVPFFLVSLLAWLNEVVYRVTGVVLVNESLSTTSMGYRSHTYVSDLARRELGWGPSKPWKEMVRGYLQQKQQQGTKKEL